jgi:hypothetical protein
VRWLFAAIWLVYLAQPASKLWSDPDLAHRYLGLADLIAFSAVFIAAFAAARFLRDQRNRRLSRQLGVAAVAAEAVFVLLAYISLGPSASNLFIYVSVMAVFMLPTRAGWTVVAACIAASLIVPWQVHGWNVDGTMAFQIFVSALAAWGMGQIIQRNAQLVAARNEITRLALADQRNQFARDWIRSGPRPRSRTWNGSPGRPWPTSGPPRPGTGRSPWPGSWPAPGPRWLRPVSRRTCSLRTSARSRGSSRSCSAGPCARA